MVFYKCLQCNKKVGDEFLRRKIVCPYCGSKIIFKPRSQPTKVLAR